MIQEKQEKTVLLGLFAIGCIQMLVHPGKTYKLLVHGVGWYDMN